MAATTDPEAARLDLYCRELKLPGLRAAYPGIAREAQAQGQSHPSFLAACLAQELESRRRHRLAAHVQQARFPALKTLDSFDFLALPDLPKPKVLALADGSFVRKRENVICLGQPGTGKTHLAIAVGLEVIQAGFRVRYTSAISLAQELLAAQQEYRLPRYRKSWQRIDLVILDELGYLGLGPGGPLLFQFCAERYERGSLLVTTNLDFSRWVEVFGDATLTAALLDRLTHHAQILLFQGESYRFRESHQLHKEVSSAIVKSYLERVKGYHETEAYRRAMRKRSVWVEPLFGEAKDWHGLRRFRLRGLWKVNCEGLLVAAGQNLKRWLRKIGWGRRQGPAGSLGLSRPAPFAASGRPIPC